MHALEDRLVRRLYAEANAERWTLSIDAFRGALAASVDKSFGDREPPPREIERYLRGLHLADLALACACVAGIDAAWEQLIREHRPALYRAADAIDSTGRAREIADAMYADLFGTTSEDGRRRSLFTYFHGRSSLGTWLRAVLAQRHVDAVRAAKRFDTLPEGDAAAPMVTPAPPPDPDRERHQDLVRRALDMAIAALEPRDRLRLACYYVQQLTLAESGRVLHEHEATVSRQLARTRRTLRQFMERWLKEDRGLSPAEVDECVRVALEDPGPLDLGRVVAAAGERKIGAADRSTGEAS